MVSANWSGKYPCLCRGEWSLEVDGADVSRFIPSDIRTRPMGTHGAYDEWHFEGWKEVWESYEDGLMCDKWINQNKYWLNSITEDVSVHAAIFNAISENDWRYDSCGGCI